MLRLKILGFGDESFPSYPQNAARNI
jgi:hypothetical protein